MCESSLDRLLERARAGLTRLDPVGAYQAMMQGSVVIDTRPEFQRRADGEIPGAIVIERNHLEWRLHPDSYCASSLAASTLQALGLQATDVVGGFRAWRDAGLPVVRPETPAVPRPAPNSSGFAAPDLG